MSSGSGTGTRVTTPSVTVLTLLTNALMEIGVIAQGETASSHDADFALSKLNRMLSSWNTRRLFCYVIDHDTYVFPSSKNSYTIGPTGADFTATRPVDILEANLIATTSTPNIRIPLQVLDWQQWEAIPVPALSTTVPVRLYYQQTYPNGTIWLWPYPTGTDYDLELFTTNQVSSFAATSDPLSFPPGYEDAITYSLAEAMCPAYGRPLTGELVTLAAKARQNIQSVNSESPKIVTDFPERSRARFNYLTGGIA